MPAQNPQNAGTAYYSQGDTYPPLVRQLLDGDGNAIDLTTATGVTITIAHASYDPYFSPRPVIVEDRACNINDAAEGIVQYAPVTGDLDSVSTYQYHFKITWSGGGVQTVPPNSYPILVVKAPPGGSS